MASRTARLVRLLALLALLAACTRPTTSDTVETRVLRARFTSGRLAHQPAGRPCDTVHDSALVARSRCEPASADADEIAEVVRVAHAATPGPGSDTTIDALHTTALVELRWGAPSAAGVDHAVDALERAVRRAPTDVVLLNDLAVAQLARAEREQQLWPLLQALDAVERAREVSDTARPVLFNRALIMERLYLGSSAERAWADYLAVERDSAWRREAEAHRRQLTLASTAPRSRQQLREAGFARLGEWGRALRDGDTAAARRALSAARAAADSLAAGRGDQSLALAVRAVDADTAAARRLALARAHADFADGVALYGAAAYERAAPTLWRAERALRACSSRMAPWAAVYFGLAQVNLGDRSTADRVLHRVLDEATPAEPALRARALWALGLAEGRAGAYEAATRRYREALLTVVRAGETESVGMLSALLMEGLELSGQSTTARLEALYALHRLAPGRRTSFLANLLGLLAGYARADGLHRAALDLMAEALDIGVALDDAGLVAWGHGERARDLVAVGRGDSAHAELARAARWSDRLREGNRRDAVRAALALVRGQLLRAADPRAARDTLLGVVTQYRAGRNETGLPNALYQAALASRDAGDTAAAGRLLLEAVDAIEARRPAFPTAEVRATFYETMENVFDAVIALELDRGRPDAAFAYLERERAAAWVRRDTRGSTAPRAGALGVTDVRERLSPGTLVLEYALLPDRLVIWAVRRDTVGWFAAPVGRDSVARLVARFGDEAASPDATGVRAALFDLLIRPVAGDVAGAAQLVVVPDRELARLPIAALWDRDARQYLVERHAVRTLPSAAFVTGAHSLGLVSRGAPTALVVGDPATDRAALPQLSPLPGAAREAARVAAIYPGARVLGGRAARVDSLLALLPGHQVFHFAGHAVVNAEQPELSYLALAADGAGNGTLLAREIGRLRLSDVKLAVLSACSTLGPRDTHLGAIAGLAYSFVRAGTPAIVSSLWDVDDSASAALLVTFHRHLAAGEPAPDALRAAQLEALRSGQAALRAPRAWAAFAYTGP